MRVRDDAWRFELSGTFFFSFLFIDYINKYLEDTIPMN